MAKDERLSISFFVVVINVRNIEVLLSNDDSVLVVVAEILHAQVHHKLHILVSVVHTVFLCKRSCVFMLQQHKSPPVAYSEFQNRLRERQFSSLKGGVT